MAPLMPEDSSALLLLAAVLISGLVFGAAARRVGLPGVTGQIVAGILLGPHVLGLFPEQTGARLAPVTHFALGLMAVAVGSHLHLHRLRNARRRLLTLVACEALAVPLFVGLAVGWLDAARPPLLVLVAALSLSTAPATVLAIVRETRAHGIFVKTLVAAVALNNLTCIVLFEIAHAAARALVRSEAGFALSDLAAPIGQFLVSILLGVLCGIALVAATWRVVRTEALVGASVVAILAAVGLADLFGASTLLASLSLGVTLANLRPDKESIGHRVFDDFEGTIFAIFFTLAGLELDPHHAAEGGLLALLVFAGRLVGKVVGADVAMRIAGAPERVRRWLGFALVPQAGLAVGLMLLVTEDPAMAPIRDTFLAVVLTVVTLNELVGPVLTRFAIVRSGEAGREGGGVLDFLQEENIVVDLRAATKEEAIARLADVLIATNHLKEDRGKFLETVLEREREESTCLGKGLMVPHGRIEGDGSLVGAMGISRDGLPFPTPDGQPVHCVVLLATPRSQQERHLLVLAELARRIGADRALRDQLYDAKSPAHAYEILHADDVEVDVDELLEEEDAATDGQAREAT